MKTKIVEISIPEELDEKELVEFAMVKVRRFLEAQKTEEKQAIDETIEINMDEVKSANGLKTRAEIEAEKVEEEIKEGL
jgi:hypothetical protein